MNDYKNSKAPEPNYLRMAVIVMMVLVIILSIFGGI